MGTRECPIFRSVGTAPLSLHDRRCRGSRREAACGGPRPAQTGTPGWQLSTRAPSACRRPRQASFHRYQLLILLSKGGGRTADDANPETFIERLDGTVKSEVFCMSLARCLVLGVPTRSKGAACKIPDVDVDCPAIGLVQLGGGVKVEVGLLQRVGRGLR